ncbi:MAG TPA: type VI secretion system tip protein TssI/VgrG [Crenalkalicoccus sp.]|nr:type VI secretion system tip protein TssI/VgrG [Crenalkalicoccus sp.]
MPYSQSESLLAIETPLGADVVLLLELDGQDAISRPFVYTVTLASEEADTAVQNLLGQKVTLKFRHATGVPWRLVNGRVRRIRRIRLTDVNLSEWQAEVVPDLWFLSRTSDCRIFQDQTVTQIIEAVFNLHNLTDFQIKPPVGTYPNLEYCVQYRESAFNFVSRLMEQFGLFYWHEHSAGSHKLVIADSNDLVPTADPGAIDIKTLTSHGVSVLEDDYAFRSGKWTLRDFDFLRPTDTLQNSAPTTLKTSGLGDYELFDYPGLYIESGFGRQVADRRMEEEEAQSYRRSGASHADQLQPGYKVKLEMPNESADYIVTEVAHSAQDYSRWTQGEKARRRRREAGKDAPAYSNLFVCQEAKTRIRAPRTTPKPFVQGPQTAIVTGAAGDEICTEEHGRVKVKFHWDRHNPKDQTSSCWVRVSQGWAGAQWGQIHIPRVGQEVIVDFLEGDPDRPIITGRVYNGDNKVPYGLPANKTQSGIKSNSSPGGGGSNEIRFEDKKGQEQVYVHAQKDLDTVVENNETRKVGNDRTTTIGNNETTTIGNGGSQKQTTVQGNFKETITGTETRTVVGAVSETFSSTEQRTVVGPLTETIASSHTETVASAYTLTAGVSVAVTAGASITLTAPSIKQIGPSWFKTGAQSGDAYGFKMGVAAMKIDIASVAIGIVPVLKFDVAGVKMDNFGVAIKTGGLELKNKGLKSKTYGFELKTGFSIKS